MKLDIACGQNKQQGFTGIDIANIDGVDICHDLSIYPWPIESNSVEEAHCSHYVEHVQDLFKFFDECYRILKVGAKLSVICPHGASNRAWQDPTHIRPIFPETFLYFNKKWREDNRLNHYPVSCDFDFTYGWTITPFFQLKSEETRAFAVNHYNNVVGDLYVYLTRRE